MSIFHKYSYFSSFKAGSFVSNSRKIETNNSAALRLVSRVRWYQCSHSKKTNKQTQAIGPTLSYVVDGRARLNQRWSKVSYLAMSPASVIEHFLTSFSALSWQYRDRREHEVGTMLHPYRITSRVIYSVLYYRQHCTLQAFEHFGVLYMHNLNDNHPSRPRFEPSTIEFRATTVTNEPSGPAYLSRSEHLSSYSNNEDKTQQNETLS